jgi:Ca2+-binding RTX toxin-like protein
MKGSGGGSGGGTTITGTPGDDDILVPNGQLGSVRIDGGAGNDTLDLSNYSSTGVGVRINIARQSSSYVSPDHAFHGIIYDYSLIGPTTVSGSITNVENIIGTAGNDALIIDSTKPSYLNGGAGNDFLDSIEGNGTLVGGAGSDWLLAYHSNNILVGGTYVNGVATGDGTPDYFFGNGGATILDFEPGIDHLIFEGTPSAILSGTWQPYGSGSELVVNGSVQAILANVTPDVASTIHLQFAITPTNGQLHGTSGDDILYPTANTSIYFDANSGNDYVTHFDKATDNLVFAANTNIMWSNSVANGEHTLVGSFSGGSVTLAGLSTADAASLHIEGLASTSFGPDAFSTWSVPSDSLI